MAFKEDLRVKRTKAALSDAFIKLLSNKSFEEITVNELCLEAGVRRATFYKHFSDKLNFLTSFTRSLRNRFDTVIWRFDASAPSKDYYVSYAKHIVDYVTENQEAIAHLMSSELFPTVLAIIVEQNFRDTRDHLKASCESGVKLSASVEVTAAMCAGGVASVIYMWLKGGKVLSNEQIANEIGMVISALIDNDR